MKPTILIQLDTDPQPSVFDAVVALDAGAEHLLRHGGVTPAAVRDLVHGALFTRGPARVPRSPSARGGSIAPRPPPRPSAGPPAAAMAPSPPPWPTSPPSRCAAPRSSSPPVQRVSRCCP